MVSYIINPRFSKEEMEEIDKLVNFGVARTRADFVRKATILFMSVKESDKKIKEL